MGVKYVKDGEVGWTPVMRRRRKKNARSEESESSGNLNVNNERRNLAMYRKMDWIPKNLSPGKFIIITINILLLIILLLLLIYIYIYMFVIDTY